MPDAATTPPQHPDIHLNELDADIKDTTNNSLQPVHEAASPSSVASGPSVAREPPRKRQRTQEYFESDASPSSNSSAVDSVNDMTPSANEADTINSTGEVAVKWVRDDKFYFPSGDCVIRVDNILFKVHRFILSRDSSAFCLMFSVSDQGPGDDGVTEGEDDQHPIVLTCESAVNIRLLLSILYALPAEIAHYSTSEADVSALLSIAEMTNKYSYITTSNWAIDTLYMLFRDGIVANQWHPTLCRTSLFKRIIEVAILCDHHDLRDFAVNHWIDRILNRTANPLIAMAVADKYDLKKLQGVSYYAALLESGPRFELNDAAFSNLEPADEPSGDTQPQPSQLTPPQKARLLSGFFSLVQLWENIRLNPPTFQRPDGCTYHAHGCLGTWQHTWRAVARAESVSKLQAADVVARLKAMQEVLVSDGDIAFALTPVCRRAAMGSLKELIKKVQDDLAKYFVDLTVPSVGVAGDGGSDGVVAVASV